MQRNEFDQYYLRKSQHFNEEFIVQYPAYLEKIRKLKQFELIHQPSYSMYLGDYISIEFFQKLYESKDGDDFKELFSLLAELSEHIPQNNIIISHNPLHLIFENAFTLLNNFIRNRVHINDLLKTLNTSIKKTLEYIKNPIAQNVAEVVTWLNMSIFELNKRISTHTLHLISNDDYFQANNININPIVFVANENQQATLTAFDELIAIKKIQAQAIVDEKAQKICEDYAAFEKNVKLLKEFQTKYYPLERDLTNYLASKKAFYAMRNDLDPKYFYNKPRKEISTLLCELGELSHNIIQAPSSLQEALCFTLYNAIKLSESLIMNIKNESTARIKSLSNTLHKANAFALDHLNPSHRSVLIDATNEMINKFCPTFSIYPENRLNAELLAVAGVLVGIGIAVLVPIPLLPHFFFLALSTTFIGVLMSMYSFFTVINLSECVDKPDETLAYNVCRQLDLISKPFLLFAKRKKPDVIVGETNDDDRIPLSHYLPTHSSG